MVTKRNKTKTLLVVGLLLAVAGLTLGFAAFSNTLTIKSSATVTPDASTFKIELSADGENISAQDSIVGRSPDNDLTVTGTNATIINGGNPTISGIEVNFTKPGDRFLYEIYVHNTGEYDAYLNEVIYNNVEGENSSVVCKAVETGDETRATDALVEAACDNIGIGFNYYHDPMGEFEIWDLESQKFSNYELPVGVMDMIDFIIYYDKNAVRVDGPFTVEFGDIEFVYSTVDVNAS